MKQFLLLAFLALVIQTHSQTTSLYFEDFESTSLSVTTSSSGGSTSLWAINSNYSVSGSKSDSAVVVQGDSIFLETNTINASTAAFVTLKFSQICKIDFFDKGMIQVSDDNGATWSTLGVNDYNGTGFLNGGAFSSISYSDWDAANGSSTPQSNWWKSEDFDITSYAANSSQVKIRFVLIDADNNGARNNYGWIVDDIQVLGASCELVPPVIALAGQSFQGLVYTTGPYNVQADITDASGIASARLIYSLNNGPNDTVVMSNSSGNIYDGLIPAAIVDDTICYYIEAVDATTCSNKQRFPSGSGCIQFIVANNPPPSCVGSPIFTYTYNETFASFTPGNGRNQVGTLANNWVNETTGDSHDWFVLNRGTLSGQTGPTADHSPGDANYMYVEASGAFANTTAILNTPCYDFSNLVAPKFRFYYHMWGANMGDLHLDVFFGGQWVLDVMPIISGDQGNQWIFREVDLTQYAGNIVKLRFRANVGTNFLSDIAIDDIEIFEPLANDIAMDGFVGPNPSGCSGSTNEFVTVKFTNNGSSTQSVIPFAYEVNNGGVIRDTARFSVAPGATVNHTFQQTVNMMAQGSYVFRAWSELPTDGNNTNDSLGPYTVNSAILTNIFPDSTDFINFTTGIPGTFIDGWNNDNSDAHDWYVNDGNTPSQQTGPSGDHTDPLGLGKYLYLEATNFNNQTARLNSKCFDLSKLNQPELSFYYHMSGVDMGELHIDVNINGFLIQDIVQPIIGDQGTLWNLQTIDLSSFKGTMRVIFRGITGNGYRSDIAIDDVIIRDARPVGLDNTEKKSSELAIYPNPAEEQLNILYDQNTLLQIRNITGQIVKEVYHENQLSQINVSDLKSGVYFISSPAESQFVKKFIKR